MLTILRNAAGTWVAKLLLLLLVLSFAVWGISGQIAGGLGSNVVSVGETRVSVTEYRLAYDRQVAQFSQQFGRPITREQAQAFGIDQMVLAQLVAGAVLDEQAREMRLGLSRDRLAALTAEDPAFRGPDGRFDRNQFEWVLRQVGMSANDYLKNRGQVAVRQQIVEAVSDGMKAPDALLRAVSLYSGEDRTVDYLVLPRSLVEPVEAPSEEAVAAWFEANKASYAAPEYREISYIKLEPDDIADPAAISEDDARAYYQRTISRFTSAEQRTIEQIVFADEAKAAAALERIRGGATFEDIVAEEGKTLPDVLLGTFEKDKVADPAIAEAAFSLDQGAVSEVVPGAFGPILLRVTAITPERVTPFEEVAETVRNELALDEANRVLLDVHDAYEDARAGGDTMAEAADKQRLKVVTIDAIDRNGRTPEGTVLTDLPQSSELLREAFEAEPGMENPPISIGSVGFLFYEVDSVAPARERTLDEVRDRVAADWTANEASTRLAQKAVETENAIAGGRPIAEVAGELGLEAQTRRGLKRDGTDSDLGEAGIAAVFGVGRGQTGVTPGESGDTQIVFHVTDVVHPVDAGPDALPQAMRDRYASGLADDLLDQLVARLQSQYPVSVDRAAMQQALSF
ncbi:MAG: SurA N-terminal domain-containing protein [Aquamicrobium sp.]|uniref:peptidylprolyl isomerase n=1 Tax=Aquamicrobium sp. TaxID=1872579 RepID=UPI00349EB120|nr:SurA N-terminal domain-containing protein [Aquamicrobium sp.]